jgi:hypothetical protein
MKEFYYILTLVGYVAGCYGFAWVFHWVVDRLWWMYVDSVLDAAKSTRNVNTKEILKRKSNVGSKPRNAAYE